MYNLSLSRKVEKYLDKLDDHNRRKIIVKLQSIKENPFRYLKRLTNSNLWRLRINDYRVIIDVVIVGRKIFVLKIDKRSRVYD